MGERVLVTEERRRPLHGEESLACRGSQCLSFPPIVDTVPALVVESLLAMRPVQIFVNQQEDNDVDQPDVDGGDNDFFGKMTGM